MTESNDSYSVTGRGIAIAFLIHIVSSGTIPAIMALWLQAKGYNHGVLFASGFLVGALVAVVLLQLLGRLVWAKK